MSSQNSDFQQLCLKSPYLFLRKDALSLYFKRMCNSTLTLPIAQAVSLIGKHHWLPHGNNVPLLMYFQWKLDEARERPPSDFALRIRYLVMPSTYSMELLLQIYEFVYGEVGMYKFKRLLGQVHTMEIRGDRVHIPTSSYNDATWPSWLDAPSEDVKPLVPVDQPLEQPMPRVSTSNTNYPNNNIRPSKIRGRSPSVSRSNYPNESRHRSPIPEDRSVTAKTDIKREKSRSPSSSSRDAHFNHRSSSPQCKRARTRTHGKHSTAIDQRLDYTHTKSHKRSNDQTDYISLDVSDGDSDYSMSESRHSFQVTTNYNNHPNDSMAIGSGFGDDDIDGSKEPLKEPFPNISISSVFKSPFEAVRQLREQKVQRESASGGNSYLAWLQANGADMPTVEENKTVERKVVVLHRDWTWLIRQMNGNPIDAASIANVPIYETVETL